MSYNGYQQTNQGVSARDFEHFNYRPNLLSKSEIRQKQQQNLNMFPQSFEEFLYHKKQKELAEQQWLEKNCQTHQNLHYMQQQDATRMIFDDEERSTVTVYVKYLCMMRVEMYIHYQTNRPEDNNLEYWKKFVVEFFNPCAKKRWCISSYNNLQQKVHHLNQDTWKCGLCNNKPEKGFEAGYEILVNLFKIKYDSGILEERFFLGIPEGRYSTISGKLTLVYHKVVQRTIYETLYVVRKGKLLVDFSPNLKILSFEFCARGHEEFIPKSLIPTHINYKSKEIVDDANFRDACRKLEEMIESPMLNEYGYNKDYVIALMHPTVDLERMKKTTEFSCVTGIGPSKNDAFFNDGPSSSSLLAQIYDDGGNFATE